MKKALIALIGLSAGVLLFLLYSRKQKNMNSKVEMVYKEGYIDDDNMPKNYIYLSELKDLIDRYNLKGNDANTFFKIVKNIIGEGIKFTVDELIKIIKSNDSDELKASKIIDKVKELQQGVHKIKITWGDTDRNMPKIFPEALEQWAIEFNLYDDLKLSPVLTMKKILEERLYQHGIETPINKIKVELEFLKKNLEEGNIDRLKNLIAEIETNLMKYNIV